MDTKRFFLYFIVIAALALAGCGGNGGGAQTAMPDPDPEPPMTCPDGQTGTPPNCVTPGPTVAELFEVAQDARDDATEAGTTATQSVKDATKYSDMLTADKVRGDSMKAQMNAQTVLDAQDAVTEAVETSETAVSDLEQAEMDAEDHDNEALDRAIAAAMEVAEQAVEDTKAQANSNDLKTAVQMVTGDDEDDMMDAADHAKKVAMDVGGALAATSSTDGSGMRVDFVTDITSAGTERPMGEAKYEENDSMEMTWEKIVGPSKVMDKRVAVGAGTRAVKAASVDGMTINFDASILPTNTASDATSDAGTQLGTLVSTDDQTVNYKGINGVVFCQGSDCTVTESDSTANTAKLNGSWYFTPTLPKEWYVGTTTGGVTTYAAETQYARYGYWISGTGATTMVHVYAIPGEGTNTTSAFGLTVDTTDGATALTDTSATYSGDAIGISLYKEVNPDGTIVDGFPQTGEFTADVELTATFGRNASVSGKIMNFEGSAVDSSWEVTLQSRPGVAYTGTNYVESATNISENPVALGSGSNQGGIWTATAYGNSTTARPQGIFGHFNTHFTNGHAAGAYATKKD